MKTLREIMLDVLGLGGAGAVVYGCYAIAPVFGWIAGGSLAIIVAVIGARKWV